MSTGASVIETPPEHFIGRSEATRTVERAANHAACSDAKVLITGETGVGKGAAARLIHRRSRRAAAALVTFSCAGVPEPLLESELFGHVRGSFTGAHRDKPGLFEMAHGGTILLDEIGALSARMQAALLRFLESGDVPRVGAERPHARIDVRLVAATNRDLHPQVVSGMFREDLYLRLNVLRLAIPPLRERPEDIPVLVEFFLQAYGRQHGVKPLGVSPDALAALVAYRWPGNVRELKNVVERLALMARAPVAELDDLPRNVRASTTAAPALVSHAG